MEVVLAPPVGDSAQPAAEPHAHAAPELEVVIPQYAALEQRRIAACGQDAVGYAAGDVLGDFPSGTQLRIEMAESRSQPGLTAQSHQSLRCVGRPLGGYRFSRPGG